MHPACSRGTMTIFPGKVELMMGGTSPIGTLAWTLTYPSNVGGHFAVSYSTNVQ